MSQSKISLEELKRTKAHVSSFYGIDGSFKLKRLGRGVFLKEIVDKRLILKYHSSMSIPNYKPLNALYGVCSNNNISPKMISNKYGNFLSLDKEYMFSLQEYIHSEPFPDKYLDDVPVRLAFLHKCIDTVNFERLKNHLESTIPDINESAAKYGYEKYVPILKKTKKLLSSYRHQLIHGDMHRKNVLIRRGRIIFIDFDSCTSSPKISEVAFAAFRFCEGNIAKMERFVEIYNKSTKGHYVEFNNIPYFVIYNILQRLLFIITRNKNGDSQWIYDLENQKKFLKLGLQLLNS